MADFVAPVTIPAFGTVLKKGVTVIGNVMSIDGIGFENGERKTTHLGSLAGSRRSSIPTGQDAEFVVNYHPAQHASLVAAGLAPGAGFGPWSITPPPDDALADPDSFQPIPFTAWIKKFAFSGIEEDGTYTGTFTLAITDDLTGLGGAVVVTP